MVYFLLINFDATFQFCRTSHTIDCSLYVRKVEKEEIFGAVALQL